MKFNIHKLKKHFKSQFIVNAVVKYIPAEDELVLIEYFPNIYLPKDVIEAELPFMEIPFEADVDSYYAVCFSGDSSTGEVQIESYKLLSEEDLKEFTQ